jgi:ABC-type branched-subunit amino acid transport system substrate-binding protein
VTRALAGCLLAAAALVATGCRDSANSTSTGGDTISVYSLLPLEGPTATAAHDIVDGEKLALQQANGQVGKLTVNYRSVDSSDDGHVDATTAAKAARSAAQDPSAIAAIGALGTAEARTEIPLLNEASVALLTTASLGADLDRPELYPLGPRTFSRLVGDERSRAIALIGAVRRRGCSRTRTGGRCVDVVPRPSVAPRVAAGFAKVFKRPASRDALLGYQAMQVVLAAIRAAGPHGNDRAAVARQLQRVKPVPWKAATAR